MRIKCLAQGHFCRCQQIQTGDLTIESPWSYPLSHNSSSYDIWLEHVEPWAEQANLYSRPIFLRFAIFFSNKQTKTITSTLPRVSPPPFHVPIANKNFIPQYYCIYLTTAFPLHEDEDLILCHSLYAVWSMTSLAVTPCPLSWFAGSRIVNFIHDGTVFA